MHSNMTFARALAVVCDLAQQGITENEDDEQREILAEQNAALERIETAAPAMLAALQRALARINGEWFDPLGDLESDIRPILTAAIAAATGTPTGEETRTCDDCGFRITASPTDDSCDCPTAEPTAPTSEAAPVDDWNSHAGTIKAAQGYVSDPNQWNPPSPRQVAHLLSLSGISHGPIAPDNWDEEGEC
jgi:hypothetical protein